MAYLNAYLPNCAAYGWEGGAGGKTRIVEMANGRERRNADWVDVRHEYALPFLNISKEAYRGIKNLHLACRQMLHAFRYRDHLDDTAENEPFGIGDGTADAFQLSKLSEADGVFYQRNVYALPDSPDQPDDLVVTINGAPTTAYVADKERGLIVFDTPPANGAVLRWSGTFDIWVRFNLDRLPFSIDNVDAVNGAVALIEVPPPPIGDSS